MLVSEMKTITDGGRRNGVARNPLYRWRKLMSEGSDSPDAVTEH